MVKRERYSSRVFCPECKKKGELRWEENENPMHAEGRFDKELVSVSEGFERASGDREDPVIHCIDCKCPAST